MAPGLKTTGLDQTELCVTKQLNAVAQPRLCFRLELDGIAYDAKAIYIRVANKNYNIRGPCVVFEVKYLWNGSVKKNGVNANLVLCDWPSFR